MDVPPPTLPTDNLYKFCATFGILIMILPVYLVWTTTADFSKNAIYLIRDQLKEQIETEALKQHVKEVEVAMKRFEEMNPAEQSDSQLAKAREDLLALRAKTDASRLLLKERDLRAQDIKAGIKDLEKRIVELRVFWVSGGIIFAIGGCLASYGFRNWRTLQLKQDRLLELQIKQAENPT